MPMIRVTEKTHERLVGMKRGAWTLDDVITGLINSADTLETLTRKEERSGQTLEAQRAASRRDPRRK